MSTFLCEGATLRRMSSSRASRPGSTPTAEKLTNNGGNDVVSAVSALGYDAYMVAIEAIKAAGSADRRSDRARR